MAGAGRVALGWILVVLGILCFVLNASGVTSSVPLFLVGLLSIIVGAVVIQSGRMARRDERAAQGLQQQRAQFATVPPPFPPLTPQPSYAASAGGQRFCPACGAENERVASFCRSCGAPLQAPA
jgi:hypothetical protein